MIKNYFFVDFINQVKAKLNIMKWQNCTSIIVGIVICAMVVVVSVYLSKFFKSAIGLMDKIKEDKETQKCEKDKNKDV